VTGLRAEDGMTLPELLVTITIATIISLAAFALIEFVMKRSGEIEQRVQTTQRGRLAMEDITRQLRSQVCLSATEPPVIDGDGNQVTFYTNLSENAVYPERRVLRFDPTASTVVEEAYTAQGTTPPVTWTTTPRQRTLLTDVVAGADPVFRYYGYDASTPPQLVPLATPLRAQGNAGRVAQVRVAYVARPRNASTRDAVAIPLANDVFVRVVDPNEGGRLECA
jgi:prepilin-type N-terminal cleavage/methylation domain-containing protein